MSQLQLFQQKANGLQQLLDNKTAELHELQRNENTPKEKLKMVSKDIKFLSKRLAIILKTIQNQLQKGTTT